MGKNTKRNTKKLGQKLTKNNNPKLTFDDIIDCLINFYKQLTKKA